MLNKRFRLNKEKDFQRVFKSRPVYEGGLCVRAIFGNRSGEVRFGFIVSNKVEKRATKRNKLKRQLRAISATLIPKLPKGQDIVIVATERLANENFDEIKSDLVGAVRKLNLLHD